MTIVESLTWANNKLKEFGLDAPMLDAQLLLSCVLNVPKNYLFTHFDQALTEPQEARFEGLIDRRRHREPVAYILGWKEFYKRPFKVNPFVLIPRPDTEVLVEEAIALSKNATDMAFVDVGTGSGTIAVTLAAETTFPVIATDTSSEALAVAKQNVDINKVADKMTFVQGNLFEPIPADLVQSLGELIVCANLPYLTTRQWQQTAPEVRDYEPRLALDGGVDGLDVYNALLQQLHERRKQLPKQLTLLLEIDPDQKNIAPDLVLSVFPEAKIRIKQDLSEKPRVVIAVI